jgi:hypothetical protein
MHMRGITFPAGRYFSGYRRSKSPEVAVRIIWRPNLRLWRAPLHVPALTTDPLLLLALVDVAPLAEAVKSDPAIFVHRFKSA